MSLAWAPPGVDAASAVALALIHPAFFCVAQMTATQDQLLDQEFYMQKTYCKTASLMANSAKSIAVLSGQSPAVGAR